MLEEKQLINFRRMCGKVYLLISTVLKNIERIIWRSRGNILEGLDSHQKKLVGTLTPSQMKVWSELDVSEKEIFYEIDDNNSRDDFLQRKKLEIQNRVVETIGMQK